MPPSGQAGSTSSYTVFGRNLPGGSPAGVQLDGVELQKVVTNIALPANPEAVDSHHNLQPEETSADVFGWRMERPSGRTPLFAQNRS